MTCIIIITRIKSWEDYDQNLPYAAPPEETHHPPPPPSNPPNQTSVSTATAPHTHTNPPPPASSAHSHQKPTKKKTMTCRYLIFSGLPISPVSAKDVLEKEKKRIGYVGVMEYLSIHCGNQKGNVTFFPLCFCRGRKVAIMRILGKKTGMDAAGKNNFRHNLHDGLVGVVRMGFGV